MAILWRRFTSVLMIALGLLGLAACAAGAYAVWKVESRLQQANDRTFALVDRGLGAVEDRVRHTRQSVEKSRITTSEITHSLRDWATRKVEDRLVTQLEIEARTEKLAGQLLAADLWLDSSADSVRDFQQVLEVGRSLGAEVDPASLDDALETLASIRGRLQEAEQSVAEVRGFAIAVRGESDENRTARVLKLLARVLVTITEIGPRLERLADRVASARVDANEAKASTSAYILWTAIGCSGILAWIAAGQLALCVWGRQRWRRGATPADRTK
jgi:DNA repair ATPase RecN